MWFCSRYGEYAVRLYYNREEWTSVTNFVNIRMVVAFFLLIILSENSAKSHEPPASRVLLRYSGIRPFRRKIRPFCFPFCFFLFCLHNPPMDYVTSLFGSVTFDRLTTGLKVWCGNQTRKSTNQKPRSAVCLGYF